MSLALAARPRCDFVHAEFLRSLDTVKAALANDVFAYSSASVVATWGLESAVDQVGGSAVNRLVGIDQVGRFWDVAQGPPAWLGNALFMEKPFRDLLVVEGMPTADVTVTGHGQNRYFHASGLLQTLANVHGFEFPPPPGSQTPGFAFLPLDWSPPELPPSFMDKWQAQPHVLRFAPIGSSLRIAPAAFGGDLITADATGDDQRAYWWSGALFPGHYPNVVQELRVLQQPTGHPTLHAWASTSRSPVTQSSGQFGTHLRNVVPGDLGYTQQSLRAAYWSESQPYVVVGTSGGGILVLDPLASVDTQQSCLASSNDVELDEGYGVLGLCVENLSGVSSGRPTILWATLHAHADDTDGKTDMVSSLHISDFDPTSGLLSTAGVWFDSTRPGSPILYGICGLAVGDLRDDTDGIDEELVVTTLNGDLAMFELEPSASVPFVQLGPLRHYQILDGAVGASNGIVIDDVDGDLTDELYVATTHGVRKFNRL